MSRGRLLRQELVESALLAALAATAGLGLSVFVAEMLRRTLLPGMAAPAAYFAPRVLLITLAAAALASLLAAWLPARQTWALALAQCLEERVSALRFRRSRLLMGVVLAQTAFATVLVVGAGLFVASLLRVRALDLGFTTVRTLLVELPDGARVGGARQDEFFRAALERVRNLPGVELAVPVDSLPFGAHTVPPISVPGLAEAPGEHTQLPFLNAADPDYFRLLGMTIRRGRGVLARDDAHAPLVAVVNETMARVVWPHEDALGKCIRVGFAPGEPPSPRASASLPCREVVGIVNDARRRSLRTEAIPIMQYYLPYPQVPAPPVPDVPTISGLLVRTAGDPGRAARDVQHALQSLGAADAVPYVVVRPYQDLIDPLSRSWRVGSRLLTMSSALALLLAAVGLYALLSTAVEARRREIGVRMALGARAAHVVAAVVSEAMALAVPGVLLGILAALAGGGLAEPLLFEVSGRDPWVLASAAAALLGATLVASALPARRAAALDPGVTLRGE